MTNTYTLQKMYNDNLEIQVCCVENYVTTDHQIRFLLSRQQIRHEKLYKNRLPSHKHVRENIRDT